MCDGSINYSWSEIISNSAGQPGQQIVVFLSVTSESLSSASWFFSALTSESSSSAACCRSWPGAWWPVQKMSQRYCAKGEYRTACLDLINFTLCDAIVCNKQLAMTFCTTRNHIRSDHTRSDLTCPDLMSSGMVWSGPDLIYLTCAELSWYDPRSDRIQSGQIQLSWSDPRSDRIQSGQIRNQSRQRHQNQIKSDQIRSDQIRSD